MNVGCTAQRAIDVLIVGGFNQREIDREGAENITIKRTNSAKKKRTPRARCENIRSPRGKYDTQLNLAAWSKTTNQLGLIHSLVPPSKEISSTR